MKKKKCKICGKSFYLRGNSAKTCSEECRKENIRRNGGRNNKIWVMRHPEKRKEVNRNYSLKNSEKLKIKARKWRGENPEKVIKIVKRWRKKNPKKRNAQAVAQNNIKIPHGKLCEECNKEKAVHRHHDDYSKPLIITFLCAKCHVRLHQRNLEGGVQ